MKQLTGAALAAILLLAGCGKSSNEPAATSGSPTPATFTITGTVTVQWAPFKSDPDDGGDCVTEGGYSDIRTGAQVVVKDESSTIVSLGMLDPGHTQSRQCVFGFTVADIPEGKKFYAVEVTHRGQLQYTRSDLDKPLTLTLAN